MSLFINATSRMSSSPEPCKEQSAGLITGLSAPPWSCILLKTTQSALSSSVLPSTLQPSYLHTFQSSLDEKLSANGPLTGGPPQKWQNDPGSIPKKERFKSFQAQAQWGICKMHDQWWAKQAEEVQCVADSEII